MHFSFVEPCAEADVNTRTFLGSGTAFLAVPGLKKVSHVRVGEAVLPPARCDAVVTTESGETEMVESPLYRLITTSEGPVLQRSGLSNHGIWQSGAVISVSGEWEAATPRRK